MTPEEAYNLIVSNLIQSTHYCQSRTAELELILSQDAHYSYNYARFVLENRFILGEKIISTSTEYSCWYARNILKSRFELGEEIISKDDYFSLQYACEVMKGRFELGEEVISQNSGYSFCYLKYLIDNDIKIDLVSLNKLEESITKDEYYSISYSLLINKRFTKFEKNVKEIPSFYVNLILRFDHK